MKIVKNDLSQKFSKGIIIPHWVSAVLISILFIQGLFLKDIDISDKIGFVQLHAIFGAIVLILTVIRIVSLFKSKRPDHLETGSRFNNKLVDFIHKAMYFLILGIVVSGISTTVLGGYAVAFQTGSGDSVMAYDEILSLKPHGIMSWILIGLVVLHVTGFFKHLILTKENTLKRIF